MVEKTSIVGNLALAQPWPRLSATEPQSSPCPDMSVSCSTDASGLDFSECIITDALPARAILANRPLRFLEGSLVERVAIVLSRAEIPSLRSETDETYESTNWRSGQVIMAPVVAARPVRLYGFSDFDSEFITAAHSSLRHASLWHGTVCLKCSDELEALKIEVRQLHDDLTRWPGSYNQLLLAGSLDYCRSVISKLHRNQQTAIGEVYTAIRSYFSLCSGIYQQYRHAKNALRRVNLQFLEDKFDLLQESCAKAEVYPRLVDLDPTDIPND